MASERSPGEELRRSFVVLELLDEVVLETLRALGRAPAELERVEAQRLRAALHHALCSAFDAGAAREADLRTTIGVQEAEIRRLRTQVRQLLRRISAMREEPDEG